MTVRTQRAGATLCLLCVGVLLVGLVGCSTKETDPGAEGDSQGEATASTDNGKGTSGDPGQSTQAKDSSRHTAKVDDKVMAHLHQSFEKATRPADDPPLECNRPPDLTLTGKSVYKVLSQVQDEWDKVPFYSGGQRVRYTATVNTDLGDIVITLRSDLAPNHVRNFIALARAGYYDGLLFERIIHQQAEDNPAMQLHMVEAGCPLGKGDAGDGHIGYWLKPEFPPKGKVAHEEGTVGACRGIEADTAACRFYITLNKAPLLDGNYTVFGKVTQGLDIVRKIFLQPTLMSDQDPEGQGRPEKATVINKITIREQGG